MEKYIEAERSIIKKFRKEIWSPFITGINTYDLIQEGDRIAVCISGGKDSMLLAKCMQEIKKHGKMKFELSFLVMNPGYSNVNLELILYNAQQLQIPVHVFETEIFNVVSEVEESPCYLCARMRRGYLYKNAMDLGCNKIALGHHFDDVIETTLMSMLYNGQFKTMMPKLRSQNFKGMELIRPLYMVKEEDILAWKKYNDLQFLQCACRFTENIATIGREHESKRQEIKMMVKELRKKNPIMDKNIFRSVHDVNLETVIGHHGYGNTYHFTKEYQRPL